MAVETTVQIPMPEDVQLTADLAVPDDPQAVVAFAHGTGSSRHSPRNRAVAAVLQDEGLATLLLDLLTPAEEDFDLRTGQVRFDIGLLGGRLVRAIHWLGQHRQVGRLPLGLFGASTGAAAALVAASQVPERVGAVVSRGGRPDLAAAALPRVSAPTLLLVGERDHVVLDLNQQAYERLQAERQLEVVPGATHLFEEPGALEHVAGVAAQWFCAHLVAGAATSSPAGSS
jgi:putative phosphoribosyl transferase